MRFEAGSERWPHQSLSASQGAVAGRHCAIRQRLSRGDIAIHQAAPLAMMWNTNPSTVIPTATAAIGNRTSAVAFAPLTGPAVPPDSVCREGGR
jgi:hypothetical protein